MLRRSGGHQRRIAVGALAAQMIAGDARLFLLLPQRVRSERIRRCHDGERKRQRGEVAIDFILRLVELLVKFDRAHFQRVAPIFQCEMLRHLRQIRRIKPPFRDLRRNLLREAARTDRSTAETRHFPEFRRHPAIKARCSYPDGSNTRDAAIHPHSKSANRFLLLPALTGVRRDANRPCGARPA